MFTWMRYSLDGYTLLKRIGLRYDRIELQLNKIGIQLAYFLYPNLIAIDFVDIPTMNTVWDLAHRVLPEFVEITGGRRFEEREPPTALIEYLNQSGFLTSSKRALKFEFI